MMEVNLEWDLVRMRLIAKLTSSAMSYTTAMEGMGGQSFLSYVHLGFLRICSLRQSVVSFHPLDSNAYKQVEPMKGFNRCDQYLAPVLVRHTSKFLASAFRI